jgi:hypothetical protein
MVHGDVVIGRPERVKACPYGGAVKPNTGRVTTPLLDSTFAPVLP